MFTLGYPYDRGYAQTMHDFVISLRDDSKFKIKTAVMGYSNYEAGQQVNKFLTEKLKASGVEIIGEAPLDIRAQDQTAAMICIRSLKPDIVAGLVTPRDGSCCIRPDTISTITAASSAAAPAAIPTCRCGRTLGPKSARPY